MNRLFITAGIIFLSCLHFTIYAGENENARFLVDVELYDSVVPGNQGNNTICDIDSGHIFYVSLFVENCSNLDAYEFKLHYDPNNVTFHSYFTDNAVLGEINFLRDGDMGNSLISASSSGDTWASVGCTRAGVQDDAAAPDGNGYLGYLAFTAQANNPGGIFFDDICFINNKGSSDPLNENVAVLSNCQCIPLSPKKLNLISFNVCPANDSISNLTDDIETLLVAQDDEGHFYIPSYNVNTIGRTDFSNGYQVYYTANENDSLFNAGDPLQPDTITQSLGTSKLYMISYPYQEPYPVTDVFASISDKVVVVQNDEGEFWIPSFSVNTIHDMQPGKGYQIYVDQSVEFTYPDLFADTSGQAKSAESVVYHKEKPIHFEYTETGQAQAVVIKNSKIKLEHGDEVGLFSQSLCVGAGVFHGHYPFVIPAWQSVELKDVQLSGFVPGEDIKVKVWRAEDGISREAEIEFRDEKASRFGQTPLAVCNITGMQEESFVPDKYCLQRAFPNPFNPETAIVYELPEPNKVRIQIFNTLGRQVTTLVDGMKSRGQHRIMWNGTNNQGIQVSTGVYVVVMRAGDYSHKIKVCFVK